MTTEVDHRCKPGLREVDQDCNWHSKHYWCKFCKGFYGVPHDFGCHTRQQAETGYVVRLPDHCACRYCENDRAARGGAAANG